MASAIPTTDGIAGEQRYRSGEFFTPGSGTAVDVAKPASEPGHGQTGPRSHLPPAGGDGRPR